MRTNVQTTTNSIVINRTLRNTYQLLSATCSQACFTF